jgi:hypothetical protein
LQHRDARRSILPLATEREARLDIPIRIPKVIPRTQILEYVKYIPSDGSRAADQPAPRPPATDYREETVLRTLRQATHVALFLAWDSGHQPAIADRLVGILRDIDRQIEDLDIEARR